MGSRAGAKVPKNLDDDGGSGGQRYKRTFKNGQQGGGQRFEGTLMMVAWRRTKVQKNLENDDGSAAADKGSKEPLKEPLKMGSRAVGKGSKEPLKIAGRRTTKVQKNL
jgi:hypothetical protein